MTTMKDSGERQAFETGAVRDTVEDKPRPDLISPYADEREGEWMRLGAEKYEARNWEAGMPISRCIASLRRHLMAYMMGKTDEDHMAAVRTNASFILHFEHGIKAGRLPASLDDMPKYDQRRTYYTDDRQAFEILESISQKEATRDETPMEERRPTLYIAGPMRGKPRLNWEAFFDAEEQLQAAGYNTINPARLDQERGIDPDTFEESQDLSQGLLRQIVESDTKHLIDLDPYSGDGVALLDDAHTSTGARAERALAKWLRLAVHSVDYWCDPSVEKYDV